LTLETPAGTTIMDCNSLENPSPSDYPEGVNFDFGFFNFTIAGINNGDNVTVTLYLPDGDQPDTYYKYGGTPENPVPHWYEFMYDGETGAEIDGNVITIHFVDGKRGDDDLSANGSVVDDGGPGVMSTSPPAETSGGGGGGCFINSLMY